jgi:heme O synthase-like polyprenyltransferase
LLVGCIILTFSGVLIKPEILLDLFAFWCTLLALGLETAGGGLTTCLVKRNISVATEKTCKRQLVVPLMFRQGVFQPDM